MPYTEWDAINGLHAVSCKILEDYLKEANEKGIYPEVKWDGVYEIVRRTKKVERAMYELTRYLKWD